MKLGENKEGFGVNPAGVRALKDLGQRLSEQIEIIRVTGVAVINCLQSHSIGLGPHVASIDRVLESINQETIQVATPVTELAEKVNKVAAAYQGIIDNDRYRSDSSGSGQIGGHGVDQTIPVAGGLGKSVNGASEVIIKTQSASDANVTFPKDFTPPYKPDTQTQIIEITKETKIGEYVRVYDNVNSSQAGGWLMKADDIAGLTPQQIQSKFALPITPTHVTDVILESGTRLRAGIANCAFDFEGGGTQFDTMGQRVGEFINGRLLP